MKLQQKRTCSAMVEDRKLSDIPKDVLLNNVFALLEEEDLWKARRTSTLFAEAYLHQKREDWTLYNQSHLRYGYDMNEISNGCRRIFYLAKKGYCFCRLISICIEESDYLSLLTPKLFPRLSAVQLSYVSDCSTLNHIHPRVTKMAIFEGDLSNDFMSTLETYFPNLRLLNIQKGNAEWLTKIPKTIQQLEFHDVSNLSLNVLAPLDELKYLELDMYYSEIGNPQFEHPPVNLEVLNITRYPIGDFSALWPAPTLKVLRFETAGDWMNIINTVNFPSLRRIELWVQETVSIPVFPLVTNLKIGSTYGKCSLSNETLCKLGDWSSLVSLTLKDVRLPIIMEFPRMPNLKRLVLHSDLWDTQILNNITERNFPKLKTLALSGGRKSNVQIHMLPSHPTLEILDLSYYDIDMSILNFTRKRFPKFKGWEMPREDEIWELM